MHAMRLASGTPSALLDWNNNYGDDPDKAVCFHCSNLPKHFFVEARMDYQAIIAGTVGKVRRDPMAMLPFIGYNIRDYLVHWSRMRKDMKDCPRIFPAISPLPKAALRRRSSESAPMSSPACPMR